MITHGVARGLLWRCLRRCCVDVPFGGCSLELLTLTNTVSPTPSSLYLPSLVHFMSLALVRWAVDYMLVIPVSSSAFWKEDKTVKLANSCRSCCSRGTETQGSSSFPSKLDYQSCASHGARPSVPTGIAVGADGGSCARNGVHGEICSSPKNMT